MNNIILENVRFSYGEGFKLEIDNLEFAEPGFFAVCGPNGAGKTTLLKIAATIIKPESGTVKIKGTDACKLNVKEKAGFISYVPQVYDETFDFTAFEIVSMGRRPYTDMLGILGGDDKKIIKSALEKFGILHKADKSFNSLSGGEKRAVLIARAYAQEADWVLMDEPSAFLDPAHVAMLGACINELKASGRKIITVTHDIDFAMEMKGKIIFMKGGKVEHIVKADSVTDEIINSVFGKSVGLDETKRIKIKYQEAL